MPAPATPDLGLYLEAERGPTSRHSLQINWDYPVFQTAMAQASGKTRAKAARKALERQLAFSEIAGEDRRPLLVLRECIVCNGTDDALLSQQGDNEKTLLLTRYFHCVKLPPEVLDEDHPFTKLFPGEEPPHLFVAQPDGDEFLPLTGEQSRTELWEVMGRALAEAYKKNPEGRLRDLTKCLDRLDIIDDKIEQGERRIERELEDRGPRSRKLKPMQKELQELKAERAEIKKRMQQLAQAELKKRKAEAEKAG